jgi:2-oxo-4-hydroxy-4-carboxy-5-ureidoimidazoline decarboxylase
MAEEEVAEPPVRPEAAILLEAHVVLNALEREAAAEALRRACGAEGWVQRMLARRPFASSDALYASADDEWRASTRADYLEAFGHHPQIGENLEALRRRFQSTAGLSQREQAGVDGADEATLLALRDANAAYRERFGFIFIICATGKTAAEMLAALRARLDNEPDTELSIAAAEHAKITRLRLAGLASAAGASAAGASTEGASSGGPSRGGISTRGPREEKRS